MRMVADLTPSPALLLHEGGWDEVLMVAVALGIAYLVIVWTGRRNQDEDEDEEVEENDPSDAGPPEATSDHSPGQRS
jgi:hypothetical protein